MANMGVAIFENAQQARIVLIDAGWVPLVAFNDAEHFVRVGRRCILEYEGDVPADAELLDCRHVTFVRVGDGIIAQPD